MASDNNFKHIVNGVNLVPNAVTEVASPGDIDYDLASGQFNFYSAGGAGHLVTDTGTQTLTNKTLTVGPTGPNFIIGPTPSTAAIFDPTTGYLDSSITTSTELGYVHGVTSSIQTQLNSKQGSLTFADSLVNTSGTVTLVGDTATPGPTQYYGTNGSSVLGYYNIPATGVTSVALAAPSIFTVSGSPVTSSGTLTLSYSGTALPIANGGTGQTSTSAAFNALAPATSTGGLIYGSGTNTYSNLAIGSTNQVLQVISGLPSWQTFTALTNPMTTTGDIIYSSSGSTPARLGIGTTGQVLTVVSGLPAWASGPSPVYYSGYFQGGTSNYWSGSSSSFGDPTLTGTATLTTRQHNGLTVSAASSNRCGITFTPSSSTAAYLISAEVAVGGNAGQGVALQLWDGTTQICTAGGSGSSGGFGTMLFSLGPSIYVPGTSSPVTVTIQMLTNTGSANIESWNANQASVEWVIVEVEGASGGGGSSYTFSDSLVNTSGTVTLVGDTASPGASMYYGTNASSVLGYYALSGGSGANTTLSNLTSPTSINQDLVSASDDNYNLGESNNAWFNLYVYQISSGNPVGSGLSLSTQNQTTGVSGNISMETGTTTGSHFSGSINIATGGGSSGSGGSGNITIQCGTTSATSGTLTLESGANTGGGTSGNVQIETGTATGGTSGNIIVQPGNATTIGNVQLNAATVIGKASTTPTHSMNTNSTTGSGVGTLSNVPGSAGNPAGYIQITINGTTSYIPYWQ